MVKYIEMETFVSNNCIDIKDINEFETLIKVNNVNIIFYGKRTARSKSNSIEGECFLFIIDSIFYVFTYHSKYGLYKSIEDYNYGINNSFEYPFEYYFSKNKKINNYFDYVKYIFDEYSINVVDIKDRDNEDKRNNFYLKFIDIINEIEDIKIKYNIKTKEANVCYIFIKNIDKEQSYTISELFEICKYGIKIAYSIRIFVDFEKEFQKNVKEDEKCEFDADKFKIYIENLFQILNIKIDLQNEKEISNTTNLGGFS